MNRSAFLQDPAVAGFTAWLASNADRLIVDLDIKRSRFVPQGIKRELRGMTAVLPHYVWRSEGTGASSWADTKQYLGQLAGALRRAIDAGDEDAAMAACGRILVWGGDRNPRVGASTFLEELHAAKRLVAYLDQARRAFGLDGAVLDAGDAPAARLNSMLTKVHALASADGLPIYDSRVAAAIATLVELWRRHDNLQDTPLPDSLAFPATLASRTVRHLFNDAVAPGTMSYAAAKTGQTARQWSSAKIRLAWLMADVLNKAGTLFADEGSADGTGRMHAFEATLFIIGYDVTCLAKNAGGAKPTDQERRQLLRAANAVLAQEQLALPRKSISTLKGDKLNVQYAGDVDTGVTGIWGKTRFALERDFLQELLGNFRSMKNVELGATIGGKVGEGTLGRWIADHHPVMSCKYASAIAAILANEGLAARVAGTTRVLLDFQ